jgi:hypothetical protein
MESILRSSVVRTLFSCPEYVFTTYHFFKTKRSYYLQGVYKKTRRTRLWNTTSTAAT